MKSWGRNSENIWTNLQEIAKQDTEKRLLGANVEEIIKNRSDYSQLQKLKEKAIFSLKTSINF